MLFVGNLLNQKKTEQVYVVPGNAGTAELATNLDFDVSKFKDLKENILKNSIKLVLVGPEIPLINGVVDQINNDKELEHILVVGPSKKGALLEGSKDFSKEFMQRHKIPTAGYKTFNTKTLELGLKYLESNTPPFVLKADGPAAGKGVLILDNLEDAKKELISMLKNNKFGSSGHRVVVEEFLDGIELSCFVLTDGKTYKILPNAKDYKRIGEGDTGLNTGGMGSISPVSFASEEFLKKVEDRIIIPTVQGLQKENLPFKGFIFIGLIMVDNDPYVIEYNVRMGDPETQVVLPRIKSDFLELMVRTANQTLNNFDLQIHEETYANIVMVAGGYPESYEKGNPITRIPKDNETSKIFHAGTKEVDNKFFTNGGRVLSVVSKGSDFKQALSKSYEIAEKIDFKDKNYRKDIGFDL